MNDDFIRAAFSLGLKVAEHAHGIRRSGEDKTNDAIFDTLKAVADGTLTLIDTPEEVVASLPTPPLGVKVNIDGPIFHEMLRRGREEQRAVAGMVVKALPK